MSDVSMDPAPTNQSQPVKTQRHANRTIVEKEIVACDEEMASLESLMTRLKHKRHALKEKLNSTSPIIVMLPLDIISEIFFMVYEVQDKRNFRPLPAPFILGRICKAWRQVVWSTPRLWSTVMIRFSPKKYANQEQLLKEWFSRVGNCQLHLFFDTLKQWEPPVALFEILLTSRSQWKTLDSWGFANFPLANNSFPSLSHLKLRGVGKPDGHVFDFTRAPKLRYVRIYNTLSFKGPFTLWSLVIPLSVKLCVTNLVNNSFENLRSFSVKLSVNTNELNDIAAAPPSLLPNLTHLSLRGSQLAIARVLKAITTPRLLSLEFNIPGGANDVSWLENAVDLQTRSTCQLSDLNISNAHITERQCMAALHSLSTVTRLSLKLLYEFQLSDFTINKLNPSIPVTELNSRTPLLPNLTEFHYDGAITFRPKTMATMLEQRLLFSEKGHRPPEDVSQVEKLRLVDIKYGNKKWSLTDPNVMQEFYRQIISLSSRGTTLNLVWDQKLASPLSESDDSLSDE